MRTNQHAKMYQNQYLQTQAPRTAQQAAQAAHQAKVYQNQAQQLRTQIPQQRQAYEARQPYGSRQQSRAARIGTPPAIVRNPSKDEITQLLDQAMKMQQGTIIRVDMEEGQEIELGIQHEEGETKITLKKNTHEAGRGNWDRNTPELTRRAPTWTPPI